MFKPSLAKTYELPFEDVYCLLAAPANMAAFACVAMLTMALEPNAPTALVPADLGKTRPSMALRWLHCPRCGQSFAVTFLRYGCPACADNITKFIESRSGMGDKKVYEAEEKFMTEACCDRTRLFEGSKHPKGHRPVRKEDLGHLAFMARDPVQRMISHHQHFNSKMPIRKFLNTDSSHGCQVSMLTGDNCFRHDLIAPKDQKVKEAVRLIESHSDMPFVGIAEYWNASIALFHATFEGDESVRPEELENLHPSHHESVDPGEDRVVPKGVADPVDQAVYDAALRRFRADAARHASNARRLRDLQATRTRLDGHKARR